MDALPFLPVELVATGGPRNVRRRWSVVAMRDLFGEIVIETRWGRIGTAGRRLVHRFATEAEALRHVRALLARRRSAPQRIGVAYVVAGPA